MIRTRRAPAKINLGLHVLRRRPDGYHDIATVFWRIPWTDRIAFEPASRLTLTCSDPALPTDERNLCLKAAHLLADAQNVQRGAHLHLDKRVPYGAGLGSGSSDAAATLRLLADAWALDVPDDALHVLAARIGADVPFFLGPPAAYATGRGDELTPLPAYRCPFALVVAVPDVHVATPDAYRLVEPRATGRPDLRAVVRSNDLARWRRDLTNDFEQPIVEQHPVIGEVQSVLRNAGAGYAALSGSGAAVFGAFESTERARQATTALTERPDVGAARCFPA